MDVFESGGPLNVVRLVGGVDCREMDLIFR